MLIANLANDTKYHSAKGQLPITYPPYHTQSGQDFVDAGVEFGYNETDHNAGRQSGFSFTQCTIKDGMRVSGNRAFLEPARRRSNLHVVTKSLVIKILIDTGNRRAYGVEYNLWNILATKAMARKEVIISAGAINSP
jgi:choline dehydrogenase-like flavoprotein